MDVEQIRFVHDKIEQIRDAMKSNHISFDKYDPVELAAEAIAVSDTKAKVRKIIGYLRELCDRYDQYYSPKAFNPENTGEDK